jgi:hypothetical protein
LHDADHPSLLAFEVHGQSQQGRAHSARRYLSRHRG